MLRPKVSRLVPWNKAPIWGLRPNFYNCQTVAGFFTWVALSDERTGLLDVASAVIFESKSRGTRDRVYLTLSDSRLPFSSPPTTHMATVEVFEPASTRDSTHTHTHTRMNWAKSFITSERTEYKSPCLTVPLLFCFPASNRCSGNTLTEPFPSSGHIRHNTLYSREHTIFQCVLCSIPSLIGFYVPLFSIPSEKLR
jgi:hypothetical protein